MVTTNGNQPQEFRALEGRRKRFALMIEVYPASLQDAQNHCRAFPVIVTTG